MAKNYLIFLFLISLIVIWMIQGLYLPVSDGANFKGFQVESGQGVSEVSNELEKQKLIKNAFWFNIYFFLKGNGKTLKAGNYSLSPTMSVAEIFNKMRAGETDPHKITIIEGWSIQDIGKSLERKDWCTAEDFYKVAGYPIPGSQGEFELTTSLEEDYEFLESKPEKSRLEGYLFPDTYHLSGKEDPHALVEKMLDNFKAKYNSLNADTERTVFEVVIMASLLEKEVKTLKDKKIVSGILWKRLKNGVPLQVDATISYITGKNTTNISTEESE